MKTKVYINVDKLNTVRRKEKALRIREDMEFIINHVLFKETLEYKLMTRDYLHGETSDYRYATPTEIYNHIMSGKETLDGKVDYEIDIDVDDYYTFKNVVGMTYANSPTINVNTKFFDYHSDMLSGSNLVHEEGHKLGFGHDSRRTARRGDSLCYLLNEVYEECWATLLGKPMTTTFTKRKWYGKRYTVTKIVWVRK